MKKQFVGPSIFGGESMTAEGVEWALGQVGAVQSDLEVGGEAGVMSATFVAHSLFPHFRRIPGRDRWRRH